RPRAALGVAVAELGDEVAGVGRGRRVVPQHRGPDDVAVGVERDHAVLLAADGYRGDVVETARVSGGRDERVPPGLGVDGRAVRVRGAALAHEGAGRGV